jgi:hypothetical protein
MIRETILDKVILEDAPVYEYTCNGCGAIQFVLKDADKPPVKWCAVIQRYVKRGIQETLTSHYCPECSLRLGIGIRI